MEDGTREVRQVRAAQNQSLFREINEKSKPSTIRSRCCCRSGEWICECADLICVERIEMTGAKYEAIRQGPNRFPVIPGHERREVERVVEASDCYLVVEKIGAGAAVARDNDPRQRH